MDTYSKAQSAADFIFAKTSLRPKVGVVLGSGLGSFAEELTDRVAIPFQEIPGFPHSTAEGHAGRLVIGNVDDVPVAAMQGRVHFYEGYKIEDVIFPMRAMARMGIKGAILTNAAGGISDKLEQGCLVILNDHINLQGTNPLIGPNEERFGIRFFDMTEAYHRPWRQLALREASRLGINVHEGVYVAVPGPSYETPAEIRAFRILGGDVVGMSTVPEVIAARHMEIKVLAISCVTNLAAGISKEPLNHAEVLEVGARVRGAFVALLKAVIPQMASEL
jgi:purine-nucleoside phosphorylase